MINGYLDVALVVDVEATCWKEAPPVGQESEIIEVGVCLLDLQTGERQEKVSLLVRPERSVVSPFCTELTTLTQEQVLQGMTFSEACQVLQTHFRSGQRIWASYGDYDRKQFERQCATRGIPYPFGSTHLNLKTLCALHLGLPRERGLTTICSAMGVRMEGTHHRGVDDAWNTAELFSRLLKSMKKKEIPSG